MAYTIGFIGVGKMGNPMCRRLAERGHSLVVYDVSAEAVAALRDLTPAVAGSPAEVARQTDLVFLSLPKSAHVEAVALGENGLHEAGRSGLVIVDTTSGEPSTTRRVAARLAEKGVQYIDAAVSGGPRGALAGTLKMMVGGPEDLVETYRPLFADLSNNFHYLGEVGAGHVMKTCSNLANDINVLGQTEALLLAVKAGLDPRRAAEAIGAGIFSTFVLAEGGRKQIGATMEINSKDVDIACRLAQELNVPLFLGSAVQNVLRSIMMETGPDADFLSFVPKYEQWTDVRLPGA
jgi:3-hydroxyisobutyrate dehydrogenase-like beta-hydroxyacid dehydrogenase